MEEKNLHEGHRERVKKRFLETGTAGFSRHQLFELLLFFGIPRKDTNELAHILDNTYGSVSALLTASYEELLTVPGMTPNAATLIRLCGGLTEECRREQFDSDRKLNSTGKIANYLIPRFVGAQNERVMLLCLDNTGRLLADGVLAEGSVSASDINIRQALQLALRCNATLAVMAHNHPGGTVTPSQEDVSATISMARALAVADIQLVDHFIIAGDQYLSMRETPVCSAAFSLNYKQR